MDGRPVEADEAWPLPFGLLQPGPGSCARCGRHTLLTHLLASMSRVYGGFAIAAAFALPIGIMIGRDASGTCADGAHDAASTTGEDVPRAVASKASPPSAATLKLKS